MRGDERAKQWHCSSGDRVAWLQKGKRPSAPASAARRDSGCECRVGGCGSDPNALCCALQILPAHASPEQQQTTTPIATWRRGRGPRPMPNSPTAVQPRPGYLGDDDVLLALVAHVAVEHAAHRVHLEAVGSWVVGVDGVVRAVATGLAVRWASGLVPRPCRDRAAQTPPPLVAHFRPDTTPRHHPPLADAAACVTPAFFKGFTNPHPKTPGPPDPSPPPAARAWPRPASAASLGDQPWFGAPARSEDAMHTHVCMYV